jgi:protein TonB
MSSDRKAFMLSLMVHGLFLCAIYTVGSTFAHTVGRPAAIDFTLLDSAGTAPARKAETPKQPAAPGKRRPEATEKPVAKRVEKTGMPRTEPASIPRPAVESTGPVAVSAKPREASPQTVSSPASGTSGNQGTAVAGKTASAAPPGGGGSNSGEQARSKYTREHYAYIKELIEKSLVYPPRARKMGWTGRVVVCFQVLKNGRVDNIRIKDSSGHEILDRNVIDTIREVEPFPRPPEWVEISMPIIYRLY